MGVVAVTCYSTVLGLKEWTLVKRSRGIDCIYLSLMSVFMLISIYKMHTLTVHGKWGSKCGIEREYRDEMPQS